MHISPNVQNSPRVIVDAIGFNREKGKSRESEKEREREATSANTLHEEPQCLLNEARHAMSF
jgi:Ni,Fe-hydrogenase maturation factor